MGEFDPASLLTIAKGGTDLAGLCTLTALLGASALSCLFSAPASRHVPLSGGQRHRLHLALCALAAPLLLFATLSASLALMQAADPALRAWQPARLLLWLLYGAIGLCQLFALQRLAFWPGPQLRRVLPLVASALLLLPSATALGLLAVQHRCLADAILPPALIAAAAGAAVSGIALWLPVQCLRCLPSGAITGDRTEPALSSAATQQADGESSGMLSPAQEMEIRLQEIAALLEQEREQGHASMQQQHEQDELRQAALMQQQVHSQKFLFESGLPCNLNMLVNGLIILDLPLDLHDHVRGDTLLHAAVREGNAPLVRHLLDNGADPLAVNWAGRNARASTQDAALQALLDEAATAAR